MLIDELEIQSRVFNVEQAAILLGVDKWKFIQYFLKEKKNMQIFEDYIQLIDLQHYENEPYIKTFGKIYEISKITNIYDNNFVTEIGLARMCDDFDTVEAKTLLDYFYSEAILLQMFEEFEQDNLKNEYKRLTAEKDEYYGKLLGYL